MLQYNIFQISNGENSKKRSFGERFLVCCTDKPNSVPSMTMNTFITMDGDSHLSGMCVTAHLKRHSRQTVACATSLTGTALHRGKDLAVAPGYRVIADISIRLIPENCFPETRTSFPKNASLFAPRGLRRTGVTRYLSACTYVYLRIYMIACAILQAGVRTFLCNAFCRFSSTKHITATV